MYGQPAEEAQATPVADDLSSIRVGLIANRTGQELRNDLERLLDPDATAGARRYTLNVQLTERENRLAVERTGFATRANVEMAARFTLIEDATGQRVLGCNSRAVSGYNLLDDEFSTLVARGDARMRVVDQIAYEIRNRLAAHFTGQARAAAPEK
jgi:hypothetical protein